MERAAARPQARGSLRTLTLTLTPTVTLALALTPTLALALAMTLTLTRCWALFPPCTPREKLRPSGAGKEFVGRFAP